MILTKSGTSSGSGKETVVTEHNKRRKMKHKQSKSDAKQNARAKQAKIDARADARAKLEPVHALLRRKISVTPALYRDKSTLLGLVLKEHQVQFAFVSCILQQKLHRQFVLRALTKLGSGFLLLFCQTIFPWEMNVEPDCCDRTDHVNDVNGISNAAVSITVSRIFFFFFDLTIQSIFDTKLSLITCIICTIYSGVSFFKNQIEFEIRISIANQCKSRKKNLTLKSHISSVFCKNCTDI